jgi:hypothetical protein
MKPELVAIVAAAISGTLTLLGVGVTVLMTNRRERTAFSRTIRHQRIEALQTAFEQALIVLERHARNFGKSSDADLGEILQTKVRLSLRASHAVRDQFEKAARALDEWAMEARQGSPRPGPAGTVMFTSGFGEEKHNKRAEELWLAFSEEREFLIGAMRADLEEAERQLV